MKCETCKKVFTPKAKHKRFCGLPCYWESMKIEASKICETCGKRFFKGDVKGKMNLRRFLDQRFCSLHCFGKSNTKYGPEAPRWKGGLPKCKTCGVTSSRAASRCSKHRWIFEGRTWDLAGEKSLSYKTLHSWVRKVLGAPSQCVFCGLTGVRMEWANKSCTYQKEVSDWLSLCVKCHRNYDLKMRELIYQSL